VLLEGGQQKVKITDFGLARAADDASISQSGIIAGTPMYMAPEQAKGGRLDQRADLFSLCSVLYQMAAGRRPFRANSTVAVLKRVAEDTPRDIQEIIPETPQWLCDIIAKLHAKNPDDRYQTAREVADVLADGEAQLKENAKLKDYSRIPRGKARRSGRRKWAAVAAAVLLPVIALAVTEFAGVTHLFRGAEPATTNPSKPGGEPTPVPVAKQEPLPFTDADVKRIAALPADEQVEEVRKELMRRNPGFDGKMQTRIEDGVVTEFWIVTDQVTDIAPIRVWSALRVLARSGTSSDTTNGLLADLTLLDGMNLAGLTHLYLHNTKVTDAGLAHFKDCKNLALLSLGGTQVSDAGLVHFQDCEDLTDLNLGRTNVSGTGLAHFKNSKKLRILHLGATHADDAGLAHLRDCKNLTSLYLQWTEVTDAGLAHFKDCKNLSLVDLTNTKVGNAGLSQLKGMPLRVLLIYNTGITDLTPLQGMPLEEVRLTPNNITPGPGHSPRHEGPQDHRHQLGASLAGGGVLAALRQGGVQVSGWVKAGDGCPRR
jgi:uncharacterized membrane protein